MERAKKIMAAVRMSQKYSNFAGEMTLLVDFFSNFGTNSERRDAMGGPGFGAVIKTTVVFWGVGGEEIC